ncbi:ABC transporter ATP-binding protein [Paenibacillus sp. MMS18-CY102]|uniref:ABC transporter ATP-binding protein n=1 Tax=Paenibacillus sp. MMS18-CY102 TaxID=2682849 RepID=UPI001365BA40|nr:ABC transporter ATP-binding protein [Paenibacillus sp. MMS18-CY102]MWC27225.1 ATP-binding cassette domain-containing protein [Paenibacillus sp. MMS18-CY102]
MSRPTNSSLIEIEKLVKTYRMGQETVTVLQEVSVTVERGDFIAIVGPSGSGKSTMMNIIGCLDIPTSGSYRLDGTEVKGLSDNKLAAIRNHKIGFIFQGFQLLPRLTAIENVELPLIYRGMATKERRAKASEALRKVGLEDRMHHKPSELSGGQQQRVAIARALAGEPPILLADEPTGALDTRTGQEVLALMEDLHRQGHTIVLITHDMDVAERAERVVRMKDGVLTEDTSGRRNRREAITSIPNGV